MKAATVDPGAARALGGIDLELESPDRLPQLIEGPPAGLTIRIGGLTRSRRHYLDTPDYRLACADAELAVEGTRGKRVLLLTAGEQRLQAPVRGRLPAFASDIEDDALHDAVAAIVAARRLDVVLLLQGTARELQVRDKRDKLVVRGALCEMGAMKPDGTSIDLPRRLQLRPVRGFERHLQRLAAAWLKVPGVTAVGGAYARAVAAGGGPPPFDSGKMDVDLQPAWPLRVAAGHLVGRLVATMRANEAGTAAAADTEFLHDFRVASRRLRALLSQVPGAVDAERSAFLREELRWLSSVTGPARDADVWMLDLIAWRRRLSPPQRAWQQPLLRLARNQQRRRQRQVAAALRSERYAQLLRSLDEVTAAGADAPPAPGGSDAPVIDVARARLRRALRRVRRSARHAAASTAATDLHGLRLEGKKLRYLLEFFRSLFEEHAVRAVIERFKALQDSLGHIQDGIVQQRFLLESARALARRRPVPERTLLLMGQLQAQRQLAADVELAHARKYLDEFVEGDGDGDLRSLLQGSGPP